MFSSSRIASCFKSFLMYVSSSTQLLVNLLNQKKSHLLVSHKHRHNNKNNSNVNKVYIVIYLLLSVISISNCAAHVDSSSSPDGFNLDEIGAIFHKVAYPTSTTTTKRSIIDNVYVPSITTVPTPSLTTFRYYEKDSQINDQHQQQIKSHHNKYELDLERDHALPTSAPNADILKSNNNPTYPNPNRHHNHNHRHQNATPSPQGHKQKSPTFPMHSGNMPSYSPPTRSFFTPPLPREYNNPFADKPTLRGTNSEVGIMDTGNFMNRRPIPPPSITPGHERVPLRPDLSDTSNRPVSVGQSSSQALNTDLQQQQSSQPKKVLNTPSHKVNKVDLGHPYDSSNGNRALLNSDNPSDVSKIIPSISRILSGSNGRKEDIPDVLLRTVTVRPIPAAEPSTNEPSQPDKSQPSNNLPSSDLDDNNSDKGKGENYDNNDVKDLNSNRDSDDSGDDEDDEQVDCEDEDDCDDPSPSQSGSMNRNNINNEMGGNGRKDETIYSTENIQNLANVNHDRSLFTSTIQPQQSPINPSIYNINSNNKFNAEQSEVQTWTIAWNIHVYLSAILFTILAVYSIFKMMFYDKLTHLFNQSYFITIHLFLIIICLARIFYLCYDAYNIHLSFDPFISEILLNLPATFLTVGFATLILFLLVRSLNHKNNRYSPLMRPLTVLVACSVHVGLCITLHYVESIASEKFSYTLREQAANGFASTASNKYYNNIIRGHSGPPRLLSLICQIIYIFVCLSLGFFYLYIYRILKRVLRNKSQNYIHGYQNLSYAIHITIAIALLFVSLAALQIYGAISVSSTKSLPTYEIDINWPQWGYQFSLRLIEVTIIALLSWVTGLKTGTSDMQINAMNMDTGGMIPPHGARSGLDFQLVNPNGTFARGYEANSFRSIGGVGIHNNPTDTIKHYPMNHQLTAAPPPHHLINHQPQINSNDNERDYFSNDNNSTIVPDHYENPNFELRCDTNDGGMERRGGGSSSESNNQNNLDEYYSEPLNAQQSQQQTHHHHPHAATMAGHYEGRGGAPYDFQNFERPTFDRSSSRNEFRVSKNLKALKSGGVPNTNTLNYNYGDNTSNHSSAYGFTTMAAGAGGGNNNNNIINSSSNNNSNFNNNSFERRSGVRKSGTLNNIGAIHHTRGGGVVGGSGVPSGVVASTGVNGINGSGSGGGGCNSSSSSSSGIVVGHHRSGIQTLNSRSVQQLQQQQQQMLHQPQYERDFSRNTSGRLSNKAKLMAAAVQQQHSPTGPLHPRSNNVMDQYQSSSGDSATSGSMLVAENGFVRFRELSDIGINEC